MTYEKFEHKVIGMLLKGEDPILEKLKEQAWDLEVLARTETDMGINIRFTLSKRLKIEEKLERVYGLGVKLKDEEVAQFELVMYDGLIDRLKGVFKDGVTYKSLINNSDALIFYYKTNETSELLFQNSELNSTGVMHIKDLTVDVAQDKIADDEETTLEEEPELELDSEEVVDLEDSKEISEEEGLVDEEGASTEEIEQVIDELVEKPTAEEITELLLPPSYSIPKVPDVIQTRWQTEDVLANKNQDIEEEQRLKALEVAERATMVEKLNESLAKLEESIFSDEILGGKAPQGPITFTDETVASEQKINELEELIDESDELDETFTDNDLIDSEIDGQVQEIEEELADAAPEDELRGRMVQTDLSEIDDEMVDKTIELMQNGDKEMRKKAVMVTLIIVVLLIILYFVFIAS